MRSLAAPGCRARVAPGRASVFTPGAGHRNETNTQVSSRQHGKMYLPEAGMNGEYFLKQVFQVQSSSQFSGGWIHSQSTLPLTSSWPQRLYFGLSTVLISSPFRRMGRSLSVALCAKQKFAHFQYLLYFFHLTKAFAVKGSWSYHQTCTPGSRQVLVIGGQRRAFSSPGPPSTQLFQDIDSNSEWMKEWMNEDLASFLNHFVNTKHIINIKHSTSDI